MRLIDADKLQKAIPAEEDNITGIGMTYNEMEAYNDGIDEQWKKIVAAPTIEPERPKGEWIIKENPGTGWYRVTCSECGEDVTSTAPCIGFYPNAKIMWDFCPNCGSYNGGESDDKG